MRKRSLLGPIMGRHAGIPGLSRSVGSAIEIGINVSTLKFYFNGTVGTTPAQTSVQFLDTNEGAISFNFMVTDTSVHREIIGGDTVSVAVNVSNQIVTELHGTTTTHTGLVVTPGTEHTFSLTWPSTGPGLATLDAGTNPAARGAVDSTIAMYIGRAQTSLTFMGPVWNVKVYSDEAMTNVLNEWHMHEGAGTTFFDDIGGDDVVFSTDLGAWAPLNAVTNAGLPVFNNGIPVTP